MTRQDVLLLGFYKNRVTITFVFATVTRICDLVIVSVQFEVAPEPANFGLRYK